MPRTGSGEFILASGNPVVTGTEILTSWANPTLLDIAAALSQSLSKDGQTTPDANLPMAGLKHLNVANASTRTEYLAAGQAQDESVIWSGSSGGLANAIALALTPGSPNYTAGQRIKFSATTTNTGAATVNVNGIGAKNIVKFADKSPLQAGDIVTGGLYTIHYDGAEFVLENPSFGEPTSADQIFYATAPGILAATTLTAAGRSIISTSSAVFRGLIDVQIFTSSGTWTKPAGCLSGLTFGVGGGAAGGGAATTGSSVVSGGTGGGGAGFCFEFITSGLGATETVTIGAAGVGVSGADGGNGGNTSFGSHWTANGGIGGILFGPTGSLFNSGGGGPGGTASGAVFAVPGSDGGLYEVIPTTGGLSAPSGNGGDSLLGHGAPRTNSEAGRPGTGFGSGGSGASNGGNASARAGGNGRPGILVVMAFT